MIFLLDYDRASGSLVMIREFDDAMRVMAEHSRLQLELDNLQLGVEREVVLLEADTRVDLRRTHRRYFETIGSLTTGPHSVLSDAA
jgi:hypothetical protein